jgi:beta-lactamase class A
MTPPRQLSRRALLGAAALLPLAGCSEDKSAEASAKRRSTVTPSASAPGSPSAAPSPSHSSSLDPELTKLENEFSARLGVYAAVIGTDRVIAHRADDRWAFCSAFKGLAAAALLHAPNARLDKRVTYTERDLLLPDSAPITKDHVATGMTVGALCDAAIRYSDGTAGNLLLRELGGPARLTEYLRTSLGDTVTQSVRPEPTLWSQWTPGDVRDTTSPRAIGEDYRKIVLDEVLPAPHRGFLRGLLETANVRVNSKERIRAGVPQGWKVADKTGTGGSYGIANDIAVVWPVNSSAPILMSIMSDQAAKGAKANNLLIARTAKYLARTLTKTS